MTIRSADTGFLSNDISSAALSIEYQASHRGKFINYPKFSFLSCDICVQVLEEQRDNNKPLVPRLPYTPLNTPIPAATVYIIKHTEIDDMTGTINIPSIGKHLSSQSQVYENMSHEIELEHVQRLLGVILWHLPLCDETAYSRAVNILKKLITLKKLSATCLKYILTRYCITLKESYKIHSEGTLHVSKKFTNIYLSRNFKDFCDIVMLIVGTVEIDETILTQIFITAIDYAFSSQLYNFAQINPNYLELLDLVATKYMKLKGAQYIIPEEDIINPLYTVIGEKIKLLFRESRTFIPLHPPVVVSQTQDEKIIRTIPNPLPVANARQIDEELYDLNFDSDDIDDESKEAVQVFHYIIYKPLSGAAKQFYKRILKWADYYPESHLFVYSVISLALSYALRNLYTTLEPEERCNVKEFYEKHCEELLSTLAVLKLRVESAKNACIKFQEMESSMDITEDGISSQSDLTDGCIQTKTSNSLHQEIYYVNINMACTTTDLLYSIFECKPIFQLFFIKDDKVTDFGVQVAEMLEEIKKLLLEIPCENKAAMSAVEQIKTCMKKLI